MFSVEIFKSLNLRRQEPMTREVMGLCGRSKECLFSFCVVTHDKTRQSTGCTVESARVTGIYLIDML